MTRPAEDGNPVAMTVPNERDEFRDWIWDRSVRDLGSAFGISRDPPNQVSNPGSRRGLKQGGHALEKGAQGRGGLGWSLDHHAAVLLAADLKL